MRASFDAILYEMDSCITKPATQIKCIKMLFPILKTQKALDPLIQSLNRINNTLNEITDSPELHEACIGFFGDLINNPPLYSLLGSTDISSLVNFILYVDCDNKEFTKKLLDQTSKLIRLSKLTEFYYDPKFIENIVYISRVNANSRDHALSIINIAKYLDKDKCNVKDLLNSFLLFSRSFANDEKFQELIMETFISLMSEQSLKEIGASAVSQFTEIASIYEKNAKILNGVFTILNASSEQIPDALLEIIVNEKKLITKHQENIPLLMEMFSSKLTTKNSIPEILVFAQTGIELFMATPKTCKNSLRVIYNCLCTSNAQDKEVCNKLVPLLTSVISFYEFNAAVVKQASVIIHQLSKIPETHEQMAIASAPLVLSNALLSLASDQKTVSILSTVLDDATKNQPHAAGQLSRPEKISSLKEVINEFSEDETILRHMLSVLYHIALASYEVQEFIELPEQKREPFYINSSVCKAIVDKHIDDIDIVKPIMMFAEPSQTNASFVISAMSRYTGDRDIQLCGLSTGLFNVSNIAPALSICEEAGVKYVIPVLKEAEEHLSPQLIEFLLSCDRNDVVDVIIDDIDRGNGKTVASLFELCFTQQLPIAKKLAELNLWKPTEADQTLIMTVLAHSIFDKRLFTSSLFFASNYRVDETTLPTLLDAMRNYPKDVSIVLPCAKFISMMEPTNYVERVFNDSRAVGIASLCLNFFADKKESNEECCFYLLKMIHIISYFESMQSQFISSMVIPLLAKAAEVSKRCSNEVNLVFSNIVDDDFVAQQIYECKGYEPALDNFNESCYFLISTLLERSKLELDEKQYQIVYKHFSGLKANQLNESTALQLVSIMESFIVRNAKVPKLDVKKFNTVLALFPANKEIVEKTLHIIPRAKEFNLNEQLLFTLFDIIKVNIDEPMVVRETCFVLKAFSKVEVHKNIIAAESTKELLIEVINRYARDSCICSTVFIFLQGYEQAIAQIIESIACHNEEEIILPISKCLLSISTSISISPAIITRVIQFLKQNYKSREICSNLMQVAFFASENESCIPVLAKSIQLFADICARHVSAVQIPKSVLGIINNICDNGISQINAAGPILVLCLKFWGNDEQVLYAAMCIIIKFGEQGKSTIFKHSVPSILNAFKNQRAQEQQKGTERTQLICDTLCSMKTCISDYEVIVSNDLIKYFLRLVSEGKGEHQEVLLKAILELSDEISFEATIFQNCKNLFDIATNKETNELTAAHIYSLLGKVSDKQLIQRYESFIPYLVDTMKTGSKYSSIAAAQLLSSIASVRPDLLSSFAEVIIAEGKHSTKPEIQNCISSIRDNLK